MKRRGQKFRLQQEVPVRVQPSHFGQFRTQIVENNKRHEAEVVKRANEDVDELFNDGMTSHKTYQGISKVLSLYFSSEALVNSAWQKFAAIIERAATVS
jgi:hypothetical protein